MKRPFFNATQRMSAALGLCLLSVLSLGACTPTLLKPSVEPIAYDLGVMVVPGSQNAAQFNPHTLIAIPQVKAQGAIDGMGIVYRYTNIQAHEPRNYLESRWVQPPADMVRTRAQEYLGMHYSVVLAPELISQSSWILLLSLDDFSQHYSSETSSIGVVQLRATLIQGTTMVDQKIFRIEQPVTSANAPGGVEALSTATDEGLRQISLWLHAWVNK